MFGIKKRKHHIFTRHEFFLILGIIAVLSIIICLIFDPSRRFTRARNEQRYQAVYGIMAALANYQSAHLGGLPTNLAAIEPGKFYVLGTGQAGECPDRKCQAVSNQADCLDLSLDLVGDYLAAMPLDPLSGSEANSGYYIMRHEGNTVTVGACNPEQEAKIELSQ